MRLQIENVSMEYGEGEIVSVKVRFSGRDAARTVSLSGYIPLSAKEYEGNESVPALETLVREQVTAKLSESAE